MTLFALSLVTALRVVATYPWIGELVRTVGGDRVQVTVLARPTEDPHFVVPRPSLIASLRRADLLVVQGADLEVGFLPGLVRQAANRKILPGSPGYLDLSGYVTLREVPSEISRAKGDIHPRGNPHYHLDPRNIPPLAQALRDRLCALDGAGCAFYTRRTEAFVEDWNAFVDTLKKRVRPLQGVRVVSYHQLFDDWFAFAGMELVATLEPLPGIPPSPGYLQTLIERIRTQDVRWIVQDVYHEKRPAEFVSRETGVPVVVLPHDVGSVPEAKDLKGLFETMLRRLLGS